MLIKICGLTRQEDLDTAKNAGAGFCGFIFHPKSPRHVSPETAASLKSPGMARVGVFVNQDWVEIMNIMRAARLDFAQLHGCQDEECAKKIGPERVIRVLWPQKSPSLQEFSRQAQAFAESCAFYLLDAGQAGGGSGRQLPWQSLGVLKLPRPWFLAGGLGPDNILAALAACSPAGIDLNSGVEEAPGLKSPKKIADIFGKISTLPKCRQAPFMNVWHTAKLD